ncbi:hypothetical protein [Lampropedia aestuarii]|uniref:hypothetical protein n=1 Tax=Lampropedia aestuarii TaxID=2562762 RepID=UPI003CC83115
MCRILQLNPSSYYAWKAKPESERALDDRRLPALSFFCIAFLAEIWVNGGTGGRSPAQRTIDADCSGHTL